MKGPGNTNGVSTTAEVGTTRVTFHCSHKLLSHPAAPHHANTHCCETCLAGQGLSFSHHPWFPLHSIPQPHSGHCTCENHVYFMYLPVCCLPTKLGRGLFEIVKFQSLSDHNFCFCIRGCCLWAKDSLQMIPYSPVSLISSLWRIPRANLPNANVQPRTRASFNTM